MGSEVKELEKSKSKQSEGGVTAEWEEELRNKLKKKGKQVALPLKVLESQLVFSREEIQESTQELIEALKIAEEEEISVGEALDQLQNVTEDLQIEKVDDGQDEALALRIEQLQEDCEDPFLRFERLKLRLQEILQTVGSQPLVQVVDELDPNLKTRLDKLREGCETHEVVISRLELSVEDLQRIANENQLERLKVATQELLSEVLPTSEQSDEPQTPGEEVFSPEIRQRLDKLSDGVFVNQVRLDQLKQKLSELEEVAQAPTQEVQGELTPHTVVEVLQVFCHEVQEQEGSIELVQNEVLQLEQVVQSGELAPVEQLDPGLPSQLEQQQQEVVSLQERMRILKKLAQEARKQQQRLEQLANSGVGELPEDFENTFAEVFREETPESKDEYVTAWRRFQPHLAFAQRAKKSELERELTDGNGHRILTLYEEAIRLKDLLDFKSAAEKLNEASEIAERVRQEIIELRNEIALESVRKEQERKEAFTFNVKTKDKKYGFDTDSDSAKFYLANVLGDTGAIETSPQLKKMAKLLQEAIEQAHRLKEKGANPYEIAMSAFKGIPKNFWPDWAILELEMFRRAKEILDAEMLRETPPEELDRIAQGFEKSEQVLGYAQKIQGQLEKLDMIKGLTNITGEVLGELSDKLGLIKSLYEIGKTGEQIDEFGQQALLEENPVKTKMAEFQKHRAIIDLVNKMVSLGCDVLGEVVPVLGIVSSGKDALMEIYNSHEFMMRLLELGSVKQGAKLDPRSAMALPFAQMIKEKRIQLTGAAFKAVAGALSTIGQVIEMTGITSAAGVAVDKAGKVIKVAGKVIVTVAQWREAEKAHKNLKKAIGPPPIRKAMLEVQKHHTKFARVILILSAQDGDPWAIRHFENIGLERTDINDPSTSLEILREYITLMSGGLMGEQVDEEQERFKDSTLGKAMYAIKNGGEKVGDFLIGRSTSAVYDPGWKPPRYGLDRTNWQVAKEDAIKYGWYDSRLKLGDDLTYYEQCKQELQNATDENRLELINKTAAALEGVRQKLSELYRTATANDKTTPHAGMKSIASHWLDIVGRLRSDLDKARTIELDKKYEGLDEQQKAQAIELELQEAMQKAVEERNKRYSNRVKLIQQAVILRSYKTPWGKLDFSNREKFLGKLKSLGLDEAAKGELQVNLIQLVSIANERLAGELEAVTDDMFKDSLKRSLTTLSTDLEEYIRVYVARAYEQSQQRAGVTEVSWMPSQGDYVISKAQFKDMSTRAQKDPSDPWDGGGEKTLKQAIEKVEKARKAFDEAGESTKNEKRGLLLAMLIKLETALKNLTPLTKKGLPHHGLILYRQEMLDEVLAQQLLLDT